MEKGSIMRLETVPADVEAGGRCMLRLSMPTSAFDFKHGAVAVIHGGDGAVVGEVALSPDLDSGELRGEIEITAPSAVGEYRFTAALEGDDAVATETAVLHVSPQATRVCFWSVPDVAAAGQRLTFFRRQEFRCLFAGRSTVSGRFR